MPLATIKSLLAIGLKDALEAATGLTVEKFAFLPSQLGIIFETLPVVIVDDDFGTEDVWSSTDQAQYYTTTLLVEMFCEQSEGDYGESSDTLIHDMKEAAESYLVGELLELPGIRGGSIEGSKVEGLPVETADTGITMRYSFVRLSLRIHP